MPVANHIHTYVKYKSKPGFMRCDAPDCTHWIDKELVLGKLSLCSLCQSEMILSKEDLRRSRPRCINCSNTKKARIHRKSQDLTRELGTESFNPFNIPTQMDLENEIEEFNLRKDLDE